MSRGGRPVRSGVRPTSFGVGLAALVVAGVVVGVGVTDVAVAGMVWAALLGLLVVGAVAPPAAVRLVRPTVVEVPTEAVAGAVAPVRVAVRRLPVEVGVRWSGDPTITWLRPGPGRVVELPLPLERRGTYAALGLELTCDAPLGVVRAVRTVALPLARDLVVGPVPDPTAALTGPVRSVGLRPSTSAVSASGEVVRAVRPYVPGDPPHLVHWPSTARTGSPVVRELDPPDATGVAVVVDLGPAGTGGAARWPSSPPGPEEVAVERAVSRAAGLARSVLATGGRVVLCTAEADGAGLAREVSDGAEVGRRLARAVAGPPPAPPPGWTAVRVSAAEGAADAAPGAADGAAGDPADGAAPVGGSR